MKINIMSDLHLDFDRGTGFSWTRKEADVFVNAGDTCENPAKQAEIANLFDITVKGNHDYYGGRFPKLKDDVGTRYMRGNIIFAYATLWTNLDNMHDWYSYKRHLVDGRYIQDLTWEAYVEKHEHDLKFLRDSCADVIVTHHSPFMESCHEKWKGSDLNASFHSDYADYVAKEFRVIPKLWIHGHTHDACDYVLPCGTRVVCNPRGYPGEPNHKNYDSVTVEI